MWSEGEHVLVRRLVGERIWYATGSVVVRDDSELLVLWQPRTATAAAPVGELFGEWELEERSRDEAIVRLMRPGRRHAILLFFHPDDTFRGWYVNLEESRRTPFGIDLFDHYLDIWVDAGGAVEWLDEDELERAVELGLMTPAQATEARLEGERVLREWPFPTGWEGWHPDPSWPVPQLPEGWDVV
jgi:hypothetical protein